MCKVCECVSVSGPVEVKATPAEKQIIYKSLTIAPEHMDVQLLEEVHDERVDLWQQAHEEDDGKTESENCRETHLRQRCDHYVSLHFCVSFRYLNFFFLVSQ